MRKFQSLKGIDMRNKHFKVNIRITGGINDGLSFPETVKAPSYEDALIKAVKTHYHPSSDGCIEATTNISHHEYMAFSSWGLINSRSPYRQTVA